jgi:hypothetical protein
MKIKQTLTNVIVTVRSVRAPIVKSSVRNLQDFSHFSGMQSVTIGPYPAAFIIPRVAHPKQWKYFYFSSTSQRPFPFSGIQITLQLRRYCNGQSLNVSWTDQGDQETEPCMFIVSKSGTLWLSTYPDSDFSKYDVVVGNGKIITSNLNVRVCCNKWRRH